MNLPLQERGKMRSIEAARAFAAFAVVLMHAANLMRVEHFSGHVGMGRIFDFGYVGVDFFFVLSGFIITYVHHNEIGQPENIPRYLWRRFSRIYPIYWIILLLTIGIVSLGRIATGKAIDFDLGISDIAGTIFLNIWAGEPKYLGVAWSLQYEVMFYLAFTLLLIHARIGSYLFIVWGIVLLGNTFGITTFNLPPSLGSAHCLQFLLGVAVGVYTRRNHLQATNITLMAAMALFVAATVFEVYGPFPRHSAEGRIALGLASSAILATLVFLERNNGINTPEWLAKTGAVSYSIYLGHIIFINLTYSILLKLGLYHSLPEALVYTTAVTASILATFAIGTFIELPLVNLLKDNFKPKLATSKTQQLDSGREASK
jgi:exopolysaccharide production protein ExoZ